MRGASCLCRLKLTLSHRLFAGKLYKLDMSSYGLVCPFPVDEFAAFTDLESLDLSDNFDLTVGRGSTPPFKLETKMSFDNRVQSLTSCTHATAETCLPDVLLTA